MAFEPRGFESFPRRHSTNPRCLEGFYEYLKNRRLAESTIETKIRLVKHLNRYCNMWDSEEVTNYITNKSWKGIRKNNACYAYRDWCQWKGFDYKVERFREESQPLPYIPLERELDQLIAGFGPKYSCFLQLLKESGFRPIEGSRLTPNDIDIERQIITLNSPAKYSRSRQFRMSKQLTSMIIPLIRKTQQNERLWSAKPNSIRSDFGRKRRYLAKKLGNPKLVKITLKTFRHWKATMEYHRTKDILYVKQLLGHKNIKNTLVYTHLVSFEEEDAFIVKVASSIEEFTELLESGFEYVSDYGDRKVLRKRK